MAGKGSAPGERRGGRQRGTPNKVTATVKDNFIAAFDKIGGGKTMAEWAKENQTEFYRLYARIIPTDVNVGGQEGNPIAVISAIPITPEAWQKKHGDKG